MTEKEVLGTKIKHLQDRKKLIISEINFKLSILEEALVLQDGFKIGGRRLRYDEE